MTASSDARADAARILHRVVWKHQTLDQAVGDSTASPVTLEIVYGSLRHYYSLSASVNRALSRPLKAKDHIVWCLMIVGAYQLSYMRTPDHAAIHETVAACSRLSRPWAKGLANAVLRNLRPPERSFEHPDWMIRLIRQQYGEDANAILLANNERAPMSLRINGTQTSPAIYRERLVEAGIAFRDRTKSIVQAEGAISTGPETLVLIQPVATRELPGYADGLVSVQDAGAQFAPYLLDAPPGSRLLDACAAPGGKLFHLLERFPDRAVTALESSDVRLSHLREEAVRLQHLASTKLRNTQPCSQPSSKLQMLHADATNLQWWDQNAYGGILLDAPCSGSGTLRRHPDIKVLREASDLSGYTNLQRSLLANLWRVLEPGGTLLYCTCSIFAEENDDVIAAFLQSQRDARPSEFALDSGRATRHGWQLLPTDSDTDGFYYARLVKGTA